MWRQLKAEGGVGVLPASLLGVCVGQLSQEASYKETCTHRYVIVQSKKTIFSILNTNEWLFP